MTSDSPGDGGLSVAATFREFPSWLSELNFWGGRPRPQMFSASINSILTTRNII